MLILVNKFKKIKVYGSIIFVIMSLFLIFNKPDLYNRIITQTFKIQVYSKSSGKLYFFSKVHEAHYKTAINIFLSKPFIGGGNKSFRSLCSKEKYSQNIGKIEEGARKGLSKGCATHPHNFYLEILSENGLFNFILIVILYILILKNLLKHLIIKIIKKNIYLNNQQIFIYLYFAILLWPIVPTGSFFSSWLAATLYLPMAFLIREFKK